MGRTDWLQLLAVALSMAELPRNTAAPPKLLLFTFAECVVACA